MINVANMPKGVLPSIISWNLTLNSTNQCFHLRLSVQDFPFCPGSISPAPPLSFFLSLHYILLHINFFTSEYLHYHRTSSSPNFDKMPSPHASNLSESCPPAIRGIVNHFARQIRTYLNASHSVFSPLIIPEFDESVNPLPQLTPISLFDVPSEMDVVFFIYSTLFPRHWCTPDDNVAVVVLSSIYLNSFVALTGAAVHARTWRRMLIGVFGVALKVCLEKSSSTATFRKSVSPASRASNYSPASSRQSSRSRSHSRNSSISLPARSGRSSLSPELKPPINIPRLGLERIKKGRESEKSSSPRFSGMKHLSRDFSKLLRDRSADISEAVDSPSSPKKKFSLVSALTSPQRRPASMDSREHAVNLDSSSRPKSRRKWRMSLRLSPISSSSSDILRSASADDCSVSPELRISYEFVRGLLNLPDGKSMLKATLSRIQPALVVTETVYTASFLMLVPTQARSSMNLQKQANLIHTRSYQLGENFSRRTTSMVYLATCFTAVETGNYKLLKKTLANASSEGLRLELDRLNDEGKTCLHIACSHGHIDCANELLKYRLDIDTVDTDAFTALHIACQHANLELIGTLLRKGADPARCDRDGNTPLHNLAVQPLSKKEAYKTVQMFLDFGLSISAVNNKLETPLHHCVKAGTLPFAKSLLKFGANPLACDADNCTPIDVAKKHQRHHMLEALLQETVKDAHPLAIEKTRSIIFRDVDSASESEESDEESDAEEMISEETCRKSTEMKIWMYEHFWEILAYAYNRQKRRIQLDVQVARDNPRRIELDSLYREFQRKETALLRSRRLCSGVCDYEVICQLAQGAFAKVPDCWV